MRTAIDTNVISALWSREPASSGLAEVLHRAGREGALMVCGPVYAELMAYPSATPAFVDDFLDDTRIEVQTVSREVWTRAGEAFAAYARRRRASGGGEPKRLLVDFVVGAHAGAHAERLLTLDAERYRTAFPGLTLMV